MQRGGRKCWRSVRKIDMIDYSKCPFCESKLLPGSNMPYNSFECRMVECGSKYSNFDNWYFVFFVNGGIDIDNVAGDNVGVGDGSRSKFKLRVVVDFRDQVTTIADVSVSLSSEIALHEVNRAYDLHNEEERECLMRIVRRVVGNMWVV